MKSANGLVYMHMCKVEVCTPICKVDGRQSCLPNTNMINHYIHWGGRADGEEGSSSPHHPP